MKERPILFSAPMVRAILAGTKTQTRRAVRKQFAADAIVAEVGATTPEGWQVSGHSGLWWDDADACLEDAVRCPYGMPGDRLWVREAWRTVREADDTPPRDMNAAYRLWYEADAVADHHAHQLGYGKLRPSIFMARWASRITLEVTGVHVERLHDIRRGDAMAEGYPFKKVAKGIDEAHWFADLWQQINGESSWVANPWVWVTQFKRVTP